MSAAQNYRHARIRGERSRLFWTVVPAVLVAFGVLASSLPEEGENFGGFHLMAAVVISAAILGATLFLIRLTQKQFLGNALHVERTHFSDIGVEIDGIASKLGMKKPDVFIFQDPVLNAFALGFKQPYTIALHSATVENLSQSELRAILCHEMGHIYFGHTKVSAFISPAGSTLPILGYVFGFWGRKCELSCDRLALMLTQSPQAVIDALIKIHIGPDFLDQLDAEGVLFQDYESRGFMGELAQTMSSHPFMTTRIKEILKLSQELGLQYIDTNGKTVCLNCGLKLPVKTVQCERCGYHFATTTPTSQLAKA